MLKNYFRCGNSRHYRLIIYYHSFNIKFRVARSLASPVIHNAKRIKMCVNVCGTDFFLIRSGNMIGVSNRIVSSCCSADASLVLSTHSVDVRLFGVGRLLFPLFTTNRTWCKRQKKKISMCAFPFHANLLISFHCSHFAFPSIPLRYDKYIVHAGSGGPMSACNFECSANFHGFIIRVYIYIRVFSAYQIQPAQHDATNSILPLLLLILTAIAEKSRSKKGNARNPHTHTHTKTLVANIFILSTNWNEHSGWKSGFQERKKL